MWPWPLKVKDDWPIMAGRREPISYWKELTQKVQWQWRDLDLFSPSWLGVKRKWAARWPLVNAGQLTRSGPYQLAAWRNPSGRQGTSCWQLCHTWQARRTHGTRLALLGQLDQTILVRLGEISPHATLQVIHQWGNIVKLPDYCYNGAHNPWTSKSAFWMPASD